MDELPKNPFEYSLLIYFWVIGIASMGGFVSYIQKLKKGVIERPSLMEFMGEIMISGFVGLLTFWICEAAGLDMIWTAPLIGISGHMGSRFIFVLEKLFQARIEAWMKARGWLGEK